MTVHDTTAAGAGRPAVVPQEPALARLIGTLRVHDVRVSAEGGALHYDAPPQAVTEELLEQLREHKAALLHWLAERRDEPPVESSGPATYLQRRMHVQHLASRLPGGLNVAQRIVMNGPLDVDALARALTALTARQCTLRCRLVMYGEELVQEVLPVSPVPLPLTDISALPPAERAAAAEEWVHEHSDPPFDLSVAPFLRTALLRAGPEEWTLLLVVHHIVIDGWGLDVLLRDLAAFYTAARNLPGDRLPTDEEAGLAPLTVTYQDVGRWQREHLTGSRLRELRTYWTEALSGASLDLHLPLDRPRPERHSNRGAEVTFHVPPALVAEVEALARARSCTVFTVLLGVYGSLLCRLTGQPEAVVACNIANRIRQEHEPLVGAFTNNVLLRLRAGGDDPAVTVDDTAGTFFAAAAHQDYPAAKVVEDLTARGTPPGERFPQAVVVLENQAAPELRLPGVRSEIHDVTVDGMRSEICLIMIPEDGGIRCLLRYARDLFEAGTAEGWGRIFLELLRHAVRSPAPR